VSLLNYAFRLMYLPIGLFGVSIATAVLPRAAERAAVGEIPELRDTVSRGLCLMLAVNIPAMFGLIVLALPIAQLLFEHGRFLPSDTLATAAALQLYALGLIGYSTVRILSPVFYAVGRSAVPVLVARCRSPSISPEPDAGAAMIPRPRLGTSIAALTNGALPLVPLRRQLAGIGGSHLVMTVKSSSQAP
jgi:putative peptidoglycan lipid II flippase